MTRIASENELNTALNIKFDNEYLRYVEETFSWLVPEGPAIRRIDPRSYFQRFSKKGIKSIHKSSFDFVGFGNTLTRLISFATGTSVSAHIKLTYVTGPVFDPLENRAFTEREGEPDAGPMKNVGPIYAFVVPSLRTCGRA